MVQGGYKKPLFENVIKRNFTTYEPDKAYVSDKRRSKAGYYKLHCDVL
jgi:hypothetical protein